MSKWADLRLRLFSILVLLPFVLASILAGGTWFAIFAIATGVLIAYEFTTIAFKGNAQQFALSVIAVVSAGLLTHEGHIGAGLIAIVLLAAVSIALAVGDMSIWKIIGVPYVALPILALLVLRDDPLGGLSAILWCALIVWVADIMAYFAGRIIGGPKLAPVLSPKKTWAGLGGAVVGAALASGLFASYMDLSVWVLVGLSVAFAILEQGGDILESALKRSHGVKDSGDLIPGHGGILDRVDGLMAVVLAAAAVGYLRNPVSAAVGLLLW
jgi:phosphatidate cytidylyltransferase